MKKELNLTATEIIEIMDQLEGKAVREFSTKEYTFQVLFCSVFGIDWEQNNIYKYIFEYAVNMFELIKSPYGDYLTVEYK